MKSFFTLLFSFFTVFAFSQPVISSFTPTFGGEGTAVTITGSGFSLTAANNIVYIGGVRATVTNATATQLEITIPAAGSGKGLIRVTNSASGLSAKSKGEFTRTFSGGILTSAAASTQFPSVNTMTGPTLSGEGSASTRGFKTMSGDFDNDGNIDYATMGTDASSSMRVFRNIASAGLPLTSSSFTIGATLNLDANSRCVYPYAEDFNGDGKVDILISRTNGFTIFINTSTGPGNISFTKSTYTLTGTYYSSKATVADFDKDGLPDIASITVGGTGVSYFRNTTSGGVLNFSTTPENRTSPSVLGDIVSGDFDNDGDPDVVVATTNRPSYQAVYLNVNTNSTAGVMSISSATFTTVYDLLPVGSYSSLPVALGVADFDNDGDLDLVSITKGGSGTAGGWVYIHRNDGSLSFNSFATGNYTNASNVTRILRTADINGDGKTDIIFGQENTAGLNAVLNAYTTGTLGTSHFATFSNVFGSNIPSGLVVDDFNNDGRVDIISPLYFSASLNLLTSSVATFYPKVAGASSLQLLSNWASNTDGTGSSPSNFSAPNVFRFSNSSGTTSFAFASQVTASGTFDIPAGATVNLNDDFIQMQGNLINNGSITSGGGFNFIGTGNQVLSGTGSITNLVINKSGTLTLKGTTSVSGNLVLFAGELIVDAGGNIVVSDALYNTAGRINAVNGTVTFNGTTAQVIPAAVFNGAPGGLVVNNSNGVSLSESLTVGNLTMSSGKLSIGNYNLTTAVVNGASSLSHVQTNGTGKLQMTVPNNESRSFPVGNSVYNPFSLGNYTGSSDQFSVRVMDEVYENGSSGIAYSGARVARTWDISKTLPNGGGGVNMTFNWNLDDEIGTLGTPRLYHFGSTWERLTGTTVTGTGTLEYSGYTGSFSPFAIVAQNSTLPVTWGYFTGDRQLNSVLLKWSTAAEQNADNFIIEHSTNALQWTAIGTKSASGTSSSVKQYSFTHHSPSTGVNYYRLVQKDVDGRAYYSNVISVNFAGSNTKKFTVYPNPVKQGKVTIVLNNASVVTLLNTQGIPVLRKELQPGTHVLSVEHLAKGIYHISADGETATLLLQ